MRIAPKNLQKPLISKPHWCICGQCKEMPDERQRVCCRNDHYNHEHPIFEQHILLEASLELAMRNNSDHLHYPFDPTNPGCWRFTAYRQYALWAWGRLGKHDRKVIPSRVVWKIRDQFPDMNSIYTGFYDVEYNLWCANEFLCLACFGMKTYSFTNFYSFYFAITEHLLHTAKI